MTGDIRWVRVQSTQFAEEWRGDLDDMFFVCGRVEGGEWHCSLHDVVMHGATIALTLMAPGPISEIRVQVVKWAREQLAAWSAELACVTNHHLVNDGEFDDSPAVSESEGSSPGRELYEGLSDQFTAWEQLPESSRARFEEAALRGS